MNEALRSGRGIDIFEFRRLLVSDVTERRGADRSRFQGVIVIVSEFQVAVANISEKPQSPNQRMIKMDESVQS